MKNNERTRYGNYYGKLTRKELQILSAKLERKGYAIDIKEKSQGVVKVKIIASNPNRIISIIEPNINERIIREPIVKKHRNVFVGRKRNIRHLFRVKAVMKEIEKFIKKTSKNKHKEQDVLTITISILDSYIEEEKRFLLGKTREEFNLANDIGEEIGEENVDENKLWEEYKQVLDEYMKESEKVILNREYGKYPQLLEETISKIENIKEKANKEYETLDVSLQRAIEDFTKLKQDIESLQKGK